MIPERGYVVRGDPGTGKTVRSLYSLTAGVAAGERALFVNLEESEGDVRRNAAAMGFDLDGIEFLDLSPTVEVFVEDRSYGVFAASEVEGDPVTDRIIDRVREVDPDRVVVDPVTQLRYLTADEYQFRKQVTGFVQFLEERDATALFTSQSTEAVDDALQFISHGVVDLQHDDGRRLRVLEFRGSATEGGPHTVEITDSGTTAFPELSSGDHRRAFEPGTVPSGIPGVDALLHGGIGRGTVTILTGPTGVGKTSLGTQSTKEAAERGERSVVFGFEESESTFLERSAAIDVPDEEMRDRGTPRIETVEPLIESPGEFAQTVREVVEERDAQIVMIDGTAGYRLSPGSAPIPGTERPARRPTPGSPGEEIDDRSVEPLAPADDRLVADAVEPSERGRRAVGGPCELLDGEKRVLGATDHQRRRRHRKAIGRVVVEGGPRGEVEVDPGRRNGGHRLVGVGRGADRPPGGADGDRVGAGAVDPAPLVRRGPPPPALDRPAPPRGETRAGQPADEPLHQVGAIGREVLDDEPAHRDAQQVRRPGVQRVEERREVGGHRPRRAIAGEPNGPAHQVDGAGVPPSAEARAQRRDRPGEPQRVGDSH